MITFSRAIILTCLAFTAFTAAALAAPAQFYIAPDGNDAWSGVLAEPNGDGTNGPLATLEAAQEKVRALKSSGAAWSGADVILRGGTYRLTQALEFTPVDSGTKNNPVTYKTHEGEQAIISGGLPITGWKQNGELWQVNWYELAGTEQPIEALWVDGEYRHVARTPNEGFLHTAGRAPAGKNPQTGEEVDRSKIAFKFHEGDIQQWPDVDDATVVVFLSWDTLFGKIASVDLENNIVEFKQGANWAFENWGANQRYFVENYREALDAPGEWHLDRSSGILSYYPRSGETMAATEIVAPRAEQLVLLQGDLDNAAFVEHINFEGLSFRHTRYPIPADGLKDYQAAFPVHGAVHAKGARHCRITNCEITQIGNYALWLGAGCQHNEVVHNEFHHLGAGGVRIGEGGDPKNDAGVAGWNVIDNNWIHDSGLIFPAAVGVWIARSSNNTVTHNEISDLYYTGVSVGWSWGYQPSSANHNKIEYNHIHHLGKGLLSDMGGIYTLGIAPGTTLRYNRIHDVYSYYYGGWGIYPDEGSSELLIENNIAYNTKTGGFHQHYGRENQVRNNIFAFALEGQVQRSREEEHTSFFFNHNIVYFDNGNLFSSTWKNDNFVLDYNLYWDATSPEINFPGGDLEQWRARGHDVHSIIADPMFVDPYNYDFTLQPDSPALDLGFEPIDESEIGLYGEAAWVNAPKAIQRDADPAPFMPRPKPVAEDFENAAVGETVAGASVSGETDKARIRVTDETAASGKHSLKVQDAARLAQQFNPHFFYTCHYDRGTATGSFAVRVEPGAVLYNEWRDAASPYNAGPSVWIDGEGKLSAGGAVRATPTPGEWYTVTITCVLGGKSDGTYKLEITPADGKSIVVEGIPFASAKFRRLRWVGFVANADADVACYLDDIKLKVL